MILFIGFFGFSTRAILLLFRFNIAKQILIAFENRSYLNLNSLYPVHSFNLCDNDRNNIVQAPGEGITLFNALNQ